MSVRRALTLAIVLFAALPAAEAQTAGKTYHLGMLETRSAALNARLVSSLASST